MVFKIGEGVKISVLEKSINDVIKRHEILRTLIKEDKEGNGYQVVKEGEEIIKIVETEVRDNKELEEEIREEINHVYDLKEEYPIRVKVYSLAGGIEYYISIVIHHIAFDGWSIGIFLEELREYYKYNKGEKKELELGELSIQYKDFAIWQREYLKGERIEKEIEYWKRKLEGYENISLITDKVRPKEIDYKGKDIEFEIGEEGANKLREIAKELGVSLYSVLLSGYYLMLSAYSNQEDIVIGTPVANRHYGQIEGLIGFFVNTLVLRKGIKKEEKVEDYIRGVGEEVIEAQLHQDLPFEKVVESLKVEKDTSRHPIFQVMFGVQDFDEEISRERRRDIRSI